MLLRDPYSLADIGRQYKLPLDCQQYLIGRDSSFVGALSPDGINRIYAFGPAKGTSLVISVAVAVDEVLGPWRRRAAFIIPITLALFLSVMAQILLFRREMRVRRAFEQQLAMQAQTDGLTGIASRRTIAESRIPREDNEGGIVTVSIGVATAAPKQSDKAAVPPQAQTRMMSYFS